MRSNRALPARARLTAGAGLLILTGALLAGCTTSSSGTAAGGSMAAGSGTVNGAAGAPAAGAASASAAAGSSSSGRSASEAATRLAASGQQLIYTAQLTVRASSVGAAVSRATSIVGASGGYVSAEQIKAGQGDASQGGATVTLKIPAAAYQSTLAELAGRGLGTQVSLSQQTQDVTQQVADTASRVTSDQAAIAQLRALLKRAGSVGDLLSVQNQINAQESDLESMLAQQKALNGETSYATVTLTVIGPRAAAKPAHSTTAPGLGGGLSGGWHALVVTLGWLLTVIGAIAPFAAVLAVVGGLAWWGRRYYLRRRAGGGPAASGPTASGPAASGPAAS